MPVADDEPIDVVLVRQVGLRDRGSAELLRERPCPVLAAVIVDEHPRALGRERTGTGSADAARRPGDDHAGARKSRLHGRNIEA